MTAGNNFGWVDASLFCTVDGLLINTDDLHVQNRQAIETGMRNHSFSDAFT